MRFIFQFMKGEDPNPDISQWRLDYEMGGSVEQMASDDTRQVFTTEQLKKASVVIVYSPKDVRDHRQYFVLVDEAGAVVAECEYSDISKKGG